MHVNAGEVNVLLSGMVFGFLLAMLFSSLLLYLVSKNAKFLMFCTVLTCQGLLLVALFGYGEQFVWSHWLWLQTHALALFLTSSLILTAVFGSVLLNIGGHNTWVLRLVHVMGVLGVLLLLVSQSTLFYGLILSLVMVGIGVWGLRSAMSSAGLYTMAWLVSVATFLSVLYWGEIKPVDAFAFNAVLTSIIWFIALTKQYINNKTDKVIEQQRAIADNKILETMQQEMLKVEAQNREDLEVTIQERTFELEVTLRELEESNRELEEKSTQDALTGIRNRRFFDKKYLAEFRRSRREQTQLSLVMVDIDHFKLVNDNHGHLAGDDVIRFVGRTIQDTLNRPSDEGCRYGGEEFALILPSTTVEGAMLLSEKVCQSLEGALIETQGGPLKITISCGVCTAIAELNMDPDHYIDLADKALYEAKHSGRNQVVHYSLISADATE